MLAFGVFDILLRTRTYFEFGVSDPESKTPAPAVWEITKSKQIYAQYIPAAVAVAVTVLGVSQIWQRCASESLMSVHAEHCQSLSEISIGGECAVKDANLSLLLFG